MHEASRRAHEWSNDRGALPPMTASEVVDAAADTLYKEVNVPVPDGMQAIRRQPGGAALPLKWPCVNDLRNMDIFQDAHAAASRVTVIDTASDLGYLLTAEREELAAAAENRMLDMVHSLPPASKP